MSKIKNKIKEAAGAVDNFSKFKKFSKLKASYINTTNLPIQTYMKAIFVIIAFIGLVQVEKSACL
jgi:hypothetical protein